MSTGFVFKHPGRVFNYMKIEQSASKDEILEKYARGSYSTENTWPYESPSAGYYDITNSTTRLILLNNQNPKSHLRGQVKPKKPPRVKDEYYDWVEVEYEEQKLKESQILENKKDNEEKTVGKRPSSYKDTRVPDPDRHFTHLGCTYRNDTMDDSGSLKPGKSSGSVTSSRPRTAPAKSSSNLETAQRDSPLDIDLLHYLYYISRRKVGYQHHMKALKPPPEFRESYNINHPEFGKGEHFYMNNLCRAYSITDLKKNKKQQYIELLNKRKTTGLHLNDDFTKYERYLSKDRPMPHLKLNTGYISPMKLRTTQKQRRSRTSDYVERPMTAYPGRRGVMPHTEQPVKPSIVENESSMYAQTQTQTQTQSVTSKRSTSSSSRSTSSRTLTNRSRTSSSSSIYQKKESNKDKSYNEVDSKDSFISSSSSNHKPKQQQLRKTTSSSSSFSTSIPIDVAAASKGGASDKSGPTPEERPAAPLGRLEDDSSQLEEKPKVLIGRSHRRMSSVSSGTSSIESSTVTITINNEDTNNKTTTKPIVIKMTYSSQSNGEKPTAKPGRKQSSSSITSSSFTEKPSKEKLNTKQFESSSVSSLFSSVSNTHSTGIINNRVKSAAKSKLTKKALDEHNKSLSKTNDSFED